MRTLVVAGLSALLAACGTAAPEGQVFGASPAALIGFSSTTDEAQVFASAKLDSHEDALDVDLVEDFGILPIRVSVERRVADRTRMELMQLVDDTLDHRLVLSDGTVLRGVSPGDVKALVDDSDVASLIDAERLDNGQLREEAVLDGYMFFKLPRTNAEEVRLIGNKLFHRRGETVYPLEVQDSIVAFAIQFGDNAELEFFVGVGI